MIVSEKLLLSPFWKPLWQCGCPGKTDVCVFIQLGVSEFLWGIKNTQDSGQRGRKSVKRPLSIRAFSGAVLGKPFMPAREELMST